MQIMSMIFILILMSLLLAGFAIYAFFWAIKNNQFDDLDTPAYSVLDDQKNDKIKSDAHKK